MTTAARPLAPLTFGDIQAPLGGTVAALAQYFDRHRDTGEDLIQGIYDPSFSAVIGPPTVGKSRFKRQSVAALVAGTPFLGCGVRPGRHRVLSFNTDPGSVHRECAAYEGLLPTRCLDDVYVRYAPPATDEAVWQRQVDDCVGQGVTVVCYDNLFGGLTGTGDVNDSAAVLPILNRLTAFAKAGIAVVLVCHTNASDTARITGSTAAEARTRAKIHIKQQGNGRDRQVTVTGNDLEQKGFQIRTTELGVESVTGPMNAPSDAPASKPEPKRERVRTVISTASSKEDAIGRLLQSNEYGIRDSARRAVDRALEGEPDLLPDTVPDGRTMVPPVPPSILPVQMSAGS